MKDSIKQIFLARNLWAMKPFYEEYAKSIELQQLVAEISWRQKLELDNLPKEILK